MTPLPQKTGSAKSSNPRNWLERLWASLPIRGSGNAGRSGPVVPPLDRAKRLADALLSERGEASGAVVARALHDSLRALDADDRLVVALVDNPLEWEIAEPTSLLGRLAHPKPIIICVAIERAIRLPHVAGLDQRIMQTTKMDALAGAEGFLDLPDDPLGDTMV